MSFFGGLSLWDQNSRTECAVLVRTMGALQLRDDKLMQVICPTCQRVFDGSLVPATSGLLCMGLFSLFWLAARTRRIGTDGAMTADVEKGAHKGRPYVRSIFVGATLVVAPAAAPVAAVRAGLRDPPVAARPS